MKSIRRRAKMWREFTAEISMPLASKVPEKYILIDRETGDCWRWDVEGGKWTRA